MDLTATTCLVTGANRGIGDAIARELAKRPRTRILVGMRNPADDPPFAAPPGGAAEIRAVKIDLSTREAIEASWVALADEPIDVLVNNAGLVTGGLLEDQELDDIYAMFQVNLVAVVQLSRAVLPGMVQRGRGTIVNNASISGYATFPPRAPTRRPRPGSSRSASRCGASCAGTGVHVLHLVTPGVRDRHARRHRADLRAVTWTRGAGRSVRPASGRRRSRAIESDAAMLRPGRPRSSWPGSPRAGPASLLDALSARMFTPQPERLTGERLVAEARAWPAAAGRPGCGARRSRASQ